MKNDALFKSCFEHATIGFAIADLDGQFLAVNPAYCALTGYSETELKQNHNYRTLTHPEDLPASVDLVLEVKTGQIPSFTLEKRYQHKEGGVVWVRNSVSMIRDGAGQPTHFVIVTEDITAHKQTQDSLREKALSDSEERYRELFENSKDAIYVHDMSGQYTSVNREAERLSGYARDELIGKHFSCLVTPQYARHVREQLCRKLEASGESTYELELTTKQGRRIPVEISSRLIVENGLPVGVQGCMRDISERKRAQEASRTYSRRLIEAPEAERRRISLELHDQVGQILTAVKMNLHALRKTCGASDIATLIEENLNVLDEAVDQVRDLSVDLRPLLLDDFGLVVAVRWYLDRQAKKSGVAVELVSLSLNEDHRFPADLETACFRIVQEAVTNIIRHAHAARISIRLERTGSDLMLVIGDDGVGFDVKAMRMGAGGTATLGLRGMEERAQAVGGSLTIDSAPRLGTQVCASFPLADDQLELEQGRSIDWVRV
ncbi:MAG TPA: PAS domain S-box protein [Pyrinomonadaceae bacterium]|nr:PAS domain S-box protein [Pyrinomonadaceae bacterium]